MVLVSNTFVLNLCCTRVRTRPFRHRYNVIIIYILYNYIYYNLNYIYYYIPLIMYVTMILCMSYPSQIFLMAVASTVPVDGHKSFRSTNAIVT